MPFHFADLVVGTFTTIFRLFAIRGAYDYLNWKIESFANHTQASYFCYAFAMGCTGMMLTGGPSCLVTFGWAQLAFTMYCNHYEADVVVLSPLIFFLKNNAVSASLSCDPFIYNH